MNTFDYISKIINIVGYVIGYFFIGGFLCLFSRDDSKTPMWLSYSIIFIWPLWLVGLGVRDAVKSVVSMFKK